MCKYNREGMVQNIKDNWLIILMSVLVVLAALSAYFVYSAYTDNLSTLLPDDSDQIRRANWGALGDYFGGFLNPFFAFFGLIMLLATLIQSQRELHLTREEIKRSTKALRDQAETQQRQRFEGTFFQLIKLHNEITDSIDLHNKDAQNTTKGRDCFKVFYKRFSDIFNNATGNVVDPYLMKNDPTTGNIPSQNSLPKGKKNLDQETIIDHAYSEFYNSNQAEVGHYFRSMYNIAKLVHESNIEDKRLYSNILRAQLSMNELLLLFYNCLSEKGKKLKPLVEEYSLLTSLPKEMLLDSENHTNYYEKSAFGE